MAKSKSIKSNPAQSAVRPSRREPGGPDPGGANGIRTSSTLSTAQVWGLCVLLFALVVWVFWPATRNGFVNFDDDEYVTANAAVQQGLNWQSVEWALGSTEAYNWHPVTWISHIVDCQLFGLDPWGHHLTSVLIHAFTVVAVFLLFRRMTGAVWRSLFVAALFGLHPLRVESVAWVAERKDVLSGLFWMLTLWAYAGYAGELQARPGGAGGKSQRLYLLALVFFALGLMSKPMLVTLPCVMLLLDYWPLGRWPATGAWALVAEKIPFAGLAAAASVLTWVAQKSGGAVSADPNLGLGARAGNALVSYSRYLGKLAWPENLIPFYEHPGSWPIATVLLAAALLAAVTILVIGLGRRRPYLPVGWLWFAGTLAPVIGLVQVGQQAMADRYSYIPSVGILLGLVWGAAEAAGRWRTAGRWLFAGGGAALLALCIPATRAQIAYWHDSRSLFEHELAVNPASSQAHGKLADALAQEGSLEQAVSEYQKALALQPGHYLARNDLAVILSRLGRQDEAIREFKETLRIKPDFAEAHKNLASSLISRGQFEAASLEAGEALRLYPGFTAARDNLGVALVELGRLDEAVHQFKQAIEMAPEVASLRNHLGAALSRQGRMEEAIRQFQEALKLDPNDLEIRNNLGAALGRAGRFDESRQQFESVLKLNPKDAGAWNNLGFAYYCQGRWEEALARIRQALALQPDYVQALNNLGLVLLAQNKPEEAAVQFRQAARLQPDYPGAHCYLGKALAALGRREEAVVELREALRLQPDYAEARQFLQTLAPGGEK